MMHCRLAISTAVALYIGYCWLDKFDPESIKGKRVLVTGASAGIGEQLAYHYARLGANVLITARSEDKLKQVVKQCQEIGRDDATYDYIVADMANMTATETVVKKAEEKLGGLDILVLNHMIGGQLGGWLGSSDNFTWLQKTLDVNLRAYVHLASHALPLLQASHGSIIVVSSLAGKIGQPYGAAYCASKFALHGFFNSLRHELAIKDVDVSITTCVLGFIGTDNAVAQLRDFGLDNMFRFVPPANPAEAALQILKGGATRAREIYYPYMQARSVVLFRDWFPSVLEKVVGYLYAKS